MHRLLLLCFGCQVLVNGTLGHLLFAGLAALQSEQREKRWAGEQQLAFSPQVVEGLDYGSATLQGIDMAFGDSANLGLVELLSGSGTSAFEKNGLLPPTAQIPFSLLLSSFAGFCVLAVMSVVHVLHASKADNLQNIPTRHCDSSEFGPQLPYISAVSLILLSSPNFAQAFAICLGINVLPEEVAYLTPSSRGVTFAVFCALVCSAQLFSPYCGDVSDRLRTPYGRRRPIVLSASLVAAAATLGMWVTSAKLSVVLYGVCLAAMAFSWAMIVPAHQGLIKDVVRANQVALVSKLQAFMFALGCLCSFCIAMVARDAYHWQYAVSVCATVLTAVVAIEVTMEPPLPKLLPEPHSPRSWSESFKRFFWLDVKRHPDFALLLLTQVIISGIAVSKSFNVFFLHDTYNITSDGVLISKVAAISIATEVSAVVVSVLTFWMPDRMLCIASLGAIITGASWLLLISCGFEASFYNILEIYGLLYGVGQGLSLVGSQALLLRYIPDEQNASLYLGLNNVAQFVGGVSFSAINAGLLQMFGRTLDWRLPGPRAAPTAEGGYRLEGFIAMFIFNMLMSMVWAGLYCKVGKESPLDQRIRVHQDERL